MLAALAAALVMPIRRAIKRWGATDAELRVMWPGDGLVDRRALSGVRVAQFSCRNDALQREIRMWRWTANAMRLVAAVGLLFVACGGGGGSHTRSTSSSATSTSIAGLQQGAQIFQAKCASCHDAKLGGQVVKDFPNIDDEIAVVTNGRASSLETMPSFRGVLTTAQIRDVVEFTRAQLGK